MTITLVDVGTTANDGTGDPLRTAFQTVNTALTRLDDTVDVQTGYVLLKDDSGSTGVAVTTAGKVGVGTTSPQRNLSVYDASFPTLQLISASTGVSSTDGFLLQQGGTETYLINRENGAMRFLTNNAEGMRLSATGSLGIGTTSPSKELHVVGEGIVSKTSGDGAFTVQGSNNSSLNISGAGNYTAKVQARQSDVSFRLLGGSDYVILAATGFSTPDETLLYSNNTLAVTIDSSQNVGIGTTNPTHELEVANASSPTIRINDTGGTSTSVSAWLEGAYSGTQAWFVGMNTSSATMTITNYLNGPLTFGTNSAEYLRITSAGSVGIGTISPTEVLDVNSDAVRIRSSQTPASATATGNAGTICWDSNYIYVCTATNTWKRAALATW